MKPESAASYLPSAVDLCERTLVTLLRGLGPWKRSMVLVGGLAPRYLIDQRTLDPSLPRHIGTLDIDLVVEIDVLVQTEAYARLEQNLQRLGFSRSVNEEGNPRHFQWRMRATANQTVIIDLLRDAEIDEGGRSASLPGERRLSALGIPGAGLVFEDFIEVSVKAELLGGRGVATETLRVCGIVSFLVLKLRAYDDRFESKDAYDVVYCVMHYSGGPQAVARAFAVRLFEQPGNPYLLEAIAILRSRFASEDGTDGSRKDGPVSYARFLALPGAEQSDLRLRQDAAATIDMLLAEIETSLIELAGDAS